MPLVSNPTAVSPPSFGMAVTEVQTVLIDVSGALAAGQVIGSVSTSMVNADTGAVVTLTHAFTLTTGATGILSGVLKAFDPVNDGLVAGGAYRYRLRWNAYPSSNYTDSDLLVIVKA